MKNFFVRHRVLVSIFIFITVSGTLYSFTAPPVYSSKSHVAIFRPKVENPDFGTEEARNRWIWIRDGLNQKSALVTDTMLRNIMRSNTSIAQIAKQQANEQMTLDYLKSLINIQFTGADENNFIIEVKAPTALIAYELNSMLFERIKYLAVDSYQENFNMILQELQKKQNDFKSDVETFWFYQDKIKKMVFNHTIEQKQRENTFEVIARPTLNETPIQSKTKFIVIISAFVGLVLGLFIEFLRFNFLREK